MHYEKNYTSKDIRFILENVVLSYQLYLTKDGKIWDPGAEEFINWLNSFNKYCLPFRHDLWENNIRELVYNPKVPKPGIKINKELQTYLDNDKDRIIHILYYYIDAAEIMETYATTRSWDEVEKIINNKGIDGLYFGTLRDILLEYSLMGVEFIDKFDPNSINSDKNRENAYLERKNYLKQIDILKDEVNFRGLEKIKKLRY